jgi:hypothetical protein
MRIDTIAGERVNVTVSEREPALEKRSGDEG